MKWEAAVFDLDGTLINSLADMTSSVNRILAGAGYPSRTIEEIRQFVGNGAKVLLNRSLPKNVPAEEAEHLLELYKKDYQAHLLDETVPYPGILPLLQQLKKNGLHLAVLSNKPHASTVQICNTLFPGIFEIAWGDRPDVPKKPDPTAVWNALEEMGIPKNKAVYIGDSETDIRTAKNAGLFAVGVSWGFRDRKILEMENPEIICESAYELEERLLYK